MNRAARSSASGVAIRRLSVDAAIAHRDRLRSIFRDAVEVAGPARYTPEQVASWALSADDLERWDTWLRDGATWIAAIAGDPTRPVGLALTWPADHVHLLYVDPAVQRRGIASALLAAVESDAREACIGSLDTNASLVSHPVFEAAGYTVVAWEDAEHRGQVFRRATMQKALA